MKRCLAKDQEKRWQRVLLWSIVPAILGALIVGIAIWNFRAPGPRPVVRSAITLPPNVTLANALALSRRESACVCGKSWGDSAAFHEGIG